MEERRRNAELKQAAYKAMVERHYNKRVKGGEFRDGGLVLWKNEASRQQSTGKLGPRWEGPYQIVKSQPNGACVLETMGGEQLPRTWNVANLKPFHF